MLLRQVMGQRSESRRNMLVFVSSGHRLGICQCCCIMCEEPSADLRGVSSEDAVWYCASAFCSQRPRISRVRYCILRCWHALGNSYFDDDVEVRTHSIDRGEPLLPERGKFALLRQFASSLVHTVLRLTKHSLESTSLGEINGSRAFFFRVVARMTRNKQSGGLTS
jgi:hypothetical protein